VTRSSHLGVLVMERVFRIKELGSPDAVSSQSAVTQQPVDIPPHIKPKQSSI